MHRIVVSVRLIWCFGHKIGTFGKLYSHSIVEYKYTTIIILCRLIFADFFGCLQCAELKNICCFFVTQNLLYQIYSTDIQYKYDYYMDISLIPRQTFVVGSGVHTSSKLGDERLSETTQK